MAPGPEDGPKRMKWMSKVCDEYSLEDFILMEDDDMDVLLRSYGLGTVPAFEDVRLGQEPEVPYIFDGSFGFA